MKIKTREQLLEEGWVWRQGGNLEHEDYVRMNPGMLKICGKDFREDQIRNTTNDSFMIIGEHYIYPLGIVESSYEDELVKVFKKIKNEIYG